MYVCGFISRNSYSLSSQEARTGQRAVMLCYWGVKADMVLLAGNTEWSISECVRGVCVDALYKSTYTLLLLYFTSSLWFSFAKWNPWTHKLKIKTLLKKQTLVKFLEGCGWTVLCPSQLLDLVSLKILVISYNTVHSCQSEAWTSHKTVDKLIASDGQLTN